MKKPMPKKFVVLLLLLLIPAGASFVRAEIHSSSAPLADAPLQVRSATEEGILQAQVSGSLAYPFDLLRDSLSRPETWCEFIPLVFNVKSCTYEAEKGKSQLNLFVGRKFYEPAEDALRLSYDFHIRQLDDDRLKLLLVSPDGPHGTKDYRIELVAFPAGEGQTRIELHSSYRPSLRSSMATRAYLSTIGRDKVGFSIVRHEGGEPVYVGGVRGIIERNAMRYYLALKAYLDTVEAPPEARLEARLRRWYLLTEEYPRQLHEMEKGEYVESKLLEWQNQQRLQGRT